MCCWQGNAAGSCGAPLKFMGLMMILIGSILLGVRTGFLDPAWFRFAIWGPVMLLTIGIWMVYRGVTSKKITIKKETEV